MKEVIIFVSDLAFTGTLIKKDGLYAIILLDNKVVVAIETENMDTNSYSYKYEIKINKGIK